MSATRPKSRRSSTLSRLALPTGGLPLVAALLLGCSPAVEGPGGNDGAAAPLGNPENGGGAGTADGGTAPGGSGGKGGGAAGGAAGGTAETPPLVVPTTMAALKLPDAVPVILSEIMFHPVDEITDEEVHEFVEIFNRSKAAVDLSGWRLETDKKGGPVFSFPAGSTIGAGQYRVIAKDKAALAAVMKWGLSEADLLGPYMGELDNDGVTVTLRNGKGVVVDAVRYQDGFPWPIAADALGVGEDWLPTDQKPITKHRFMGRSLERISTDAVATTPANWEASSLDGATPGKPNSVAGGVVPVAEEVTALGETSKTGIIRSDDKIRFTARFSAFAPVTKVELESFVDDITMTGEPTTTTPMTAGADGVFSAVLGPFKDNALIRYRVRAVRGDKMGVAAPRATDPITWYTAFITPKVFVKTGVESKEKTYHLWITPDDWTKLENWLAPGRASGNAGCMLNPNWRSVVPAIFISEGKAYDVRVRYEGSRYQRMNGMDINNWAFPGPKVPAGRKLKALSWRIKFPKYDRMHGLKELALNKMLQGCPGTVTYVEGKILENAGVPGYQENFARFHINGGYYHYMAQPEEIDEDLLKRSWPNEPIGDLFKDDGAGGDEGPVARGDFKKIGGPNGSCPMYTVADRYKATYPRVTFEYRPYDPIVQLIEELSAARAKGGQAIRDYFTKYWDVDALAATFAVRNWSGVWDDTFHNLFPYKRPSNGKWYLIQQDFEADFGLGKGNITGIGPLGTWNAKQTLYIGWNSPDMSVSKMCELPSGQEMGCNGLGFNSLKDAFIGGFKKELDDKYRELAKKGVFTADAVLAIIEEAVAKFSVDDWNADPAGKACDVKAAHDTMRAWARDRHATVVNKLMP